jgi:hypothetical protein
MVLLRSTAAPLPPQAVLRRSLGAACHASLGAGQPRHSAGRNRSAECRRRADLDSGGGSSLTRRFEAAAPRLTLPCWQYAPAKLAALPSKRSDILQRPFHFFQHSTLAGTLLDTFNYCGKLNYKYNFITLRAHQ